MVTILRFDRLFSLSLSFSQLFLSRFSSPCYLTSGPRASDMLTIARDSPVHSFIILQVPLRFYPRFSSYPRFSPVFLLSPSALSFSFSPVVGRIPSRACAARRAVRIAVVISQSDRFAGARILYPKSRSGGLSRSPSLVSFRFAFYRLGTTLFATLRENGNSSPEESRTFPFPEWNVDGHLTMMPGAA